MKTCC